MDARVPFNRPFLSGEEQANLAAVLDRGDLSSDGPFTQACSRFLEERFAIGRVLLTPSCTAALEMAAMLCDLGPGDEAIMPSYTFASTASAVVRAGARPVFVDIRPDTLNIDESLIEQAVSPHTKAIFPVHYAGVGCEMDAILEIAHRHGLRVVEDAAQGVDAFYRGRALGSLGHLAAFSFHATKNCTCGEGGSLCVNSPELAQRAEIVREKGTNRCQFVRGEVPQYEWIDVGSSCLIGEISAAFLMAQLNSLDRITAERRRICLAYREGLAPLEREGLVRLPQVPAHCRDNGHVFHVRLADQQTRDGLMAYLRRQGVQAISHYVPLHSSPMGRRHGRAAGTLRHTDETCRRLLRLPLYCGITEEELSQVIDHVFAFLGRRRAGEVDPRRPAQVAAENA